MSVKILIVDDEKDLSACIRDYITDESSHKVFLAYSGEEGLEELEKVKPDLCIVDMRLPGMNGNDFIINANIRMSQCSFIIHTGSIDYQLPEQLAQIGITKDFLLSKPIPDMAIFLEKIRKLMEL